jgi:hydrogenase nickel incorporation protein HypA/HybF
LHELSIAMSIVDMAQEESEARTARVAAVHLRLGLLSGVVKEALLSCYGMACAGTRLEGSNLLIEEIPVEIFCERCHAARVLSSTQWFCCPECGTPSAAVVRGKELEVSALEIEE